MEHLQRVELPPQRLGRRAFAQLLKHLRGLRKRLLQLLDALGRALLVRGQSHDPLIAALCEEMAVEEHEHDDQHSDAGHQHV